MWKSAIGTTRTTDNSTHEPCPPPAHPALDVDCTAGARSNASLSRGCHSSSAGAHRSWAQRDGPRAGGHPQRTAARRRAACRTRSRPPLSPHRAGSHPERTAARHRAGCTCRPPLARCAPARCARTRPHRTAGHRHAACSKRTRCSPRWSRSHLSRTAAHRRAGCRIRPRPARCSCSRPRHTAARRRAACKRQSRQWQRSCR